jgi:hypothetical protein
MTSRTVTRLRRVKKLARGSGYIAMCTVAAVVLWHGWWTWVAVGCTVAAPVLSSVAAIAELHADGRWRGWRGRGSGLSGGGRDDGDGPPGAAVHRRRMLAVVSRLMPASAGRRWLAEAESLLAEVTAARRGAAARSYLLSAPRLAVMMWAREVVRRARLGPRRPG